MKFMKLGTQPDSFYTEQAIRTVISDVPSDLTMRISNTTYLLHKYPLLPKCGLLQQLISDADDSNNATVDLSDIPGGEEAFELCAKFCYGITINLSAHNIVPAFCAARFLQMTEVVESGNFVMKLETFFSSCILEGWKDSIVTLMNTVTWSYTYTRPGYERKRHQSAPKDWWTEDISYLGTDMFRCVVSAIKSTNMLPPQLIGEALHVYACCWLPDITQNRPNESTSEKDSPDRKQRVLETIVSLIPLDKGSVSIKFLVRLLSIANVLGVSPVTRAELLRLSGLQFEEATVDDLLILSLSPSDQTSYDVELVKSVLESFLRQWKRQTHVIDREALRSICIVGKLIDTYLQVVAKDANVPVHQVASLAETLPGIARTDHDDLYKAINFYLKRHPDMSKADKKLLCRNLDCQKLSAGARAHAVRNELLPLRTVVQVLFFEQEKGNTPTNNMHISAKEGEQTSVIRNDLSKLKLSLDELSPKAEGNRVSAPGTSKIRQNTGTSDGKMQPRPEMNFKIREVKKAEIEREGEIREVSSANQLNPCDNGLVRRISQKNYGKNREK